MPSTDPTISVSLTASQWKEVLEILRCGTDYFAAEMQFWPGCAEISRAAVRIGALRYSIHCQVSDSPPHDHDEACTVGEDDVCTECGVHRGDHCPECGARAFHRTRCSRYQEA